VIGLVNIDQYLENLLITSLRLRVKIKAILRSPVSQPNVALCLLFQILY
jgi:hypothetical protein